MKIFTDQLNTCPVNSEIYRESDVQDLVNSISEVGLLQPLVVTPDRTIISGHRIVFTGISPMISMRSSNIDLYSE